MDIFAKGALAAAIACAGPASAQELVGTASVPYLIEKTDGPGLSQRVPGTKSRDLLSIMDEDALQSAYTDMGLEKTDNLGKIQRAFARKGLAWKGQDPLDFGNGRLVLPVSPLADGGGAARWWSIDMPQSNLLSIGDDVNTVTPHKGGDPHYHTIFSAPAASAPVETRVENGEYATTIPCGEREAAPATHCALYAVMLTENTGTENRPNRDIVCSGTFLTGQHVLTAAHCVCRFVLGTARKENLRVVIGYTKEGYELPVEGIRVYRPADRKKTIHACNRDENRRRHGDLALLTVAAPKAGDPADPRNAGDERPVIAQIGTPDWDDYDKELRARDAFAQEFVNYGTGSLALDTDGDDVLDREAEAVKLAASIHLTKVHPDPAPPVYVQEIEVGAKGTTLCAGDSGGGIYKALPVDARPKGFGQWALIGVVVGYGPSEQCLDGAMINYVDRRVIRLDTRAVADWLDAHTAPLKVTRAPAINEIFVASKD